MSIKGVRRIKRMGDLGRRKLKSDKRTGNSF